MQVRSASRLIGWHMADVSFLPGVDRGRPFSRVLLGGGCFWGLEKLFRQRFAAGLRSTAVGYAGGHTKKPTYEQVCTGNTGHCEVVQLQFYEDKAPLEDILRYFWSVHDPTTTNRQGNDIGTQYRSAVFVNSQEHKLIAQKIREEMQQKWNPHRVVTEINGKDDPGVDSTFWIAEPYHQLYLEKNPGGYCNHRQRF